MKTIYILRHAKSSWEFPHLTDEERPLTDKGRKRTRRINKYLEEHQIKVDLIISSHAVRAYETAKIVARAIGYPLEKIRINKMIYHSDEDNLINQFYDLSDDLQSVMLVGHNPALTNFVNRFLEEKIEWLPTSGLASISFDTNHWSEIDRAKHRVNFLVTPSLLKKNPEYE